MNVASVNQILHLVQMKVNDNFHQFDFCNTTENAQHYGVEHNKVPPKIELKNISALDIPITVIHGQKGPLSTFENATKLKNEIGDFANNKLKFEI